MLLTVLVIYSFFKLFIVLLKDIHLIIILLIAYDMLLYNVSTKEKLQEYIKTTARTRINNFKHKFMPDVNDLASAIEALKNIIPVIGKDKRA